MTKSTTKPDATFITADVVASLIGFNNAAAFLRERERLEDQQFPEPMPTCQRPLKWRREAVLAWLDAVAPVQPPMPEGPNVIRLHGVRA